MNTIELEALAEVWILENSTVIDKESLTKLKQAFMAGYKLKIRK